VNRAGAIIVMSTFAATWWIAGTAQSGGRTLMCALGMLVSAVLVHLLPLARWLPAPICYVTAALSLSCGVVLLRADRQRT
jgi:hypothetical protein